jgi:phospholipase A1
MASRFPNPSDRLLQTTLAARIAGAFLALSTLTSAAHAQLGACASILQDRERLACYDALARAERAAPAEASTPPAADTAGVRAPTELEKRWELRPELKQGIFRLLPYRPLYALAHATSDVNDRPSSPTRSIGVSTPQVDLQRAEAKLQLGFKTKLAQDIAGSAADLWFGYTQQSYWQAANSRFSSPFRETDYEPEVFVVHPLRLEAGGVRAQYVAFGFTHQSNGRGESLSRSWNRVVGELALESGPWSLHLRPWARAFDASGERDDNPDIEDYVGRGEVTLEYRAGRQVLTLNGRHTLRGGNRSRGSTQLDWAFPLAGSINGHLQIFSGYGENLIDYNHQQTTIGVGVSFFD